MVRNNLGDYNSYVIQNFIRTTLCAKYAKKITKRGKLLDVYFGDVPLVLPNLNNSLFVLMLIALGYGSFPEITKYLAKKAVE